MKTYILLANASTRHNITSAYTPKKKLFMKSIASDSALKKYVNTISRKKGTDNELKIEGENLFQHFYRIEVENPSIDIFLYSI